MSDARIRERVRALVADGSVPAKDRAVRLLVQGGLPEADAERAVYGIAGNDVASISWGPAKDHIVKGGVYHGRVRSYCGREFSLYAPSRNGRVDYSNPLPR